MIFWYSVVFLRWQSLSGSSLVSRCFALLETTSPATSPLTFPHSLPPGYFPSDVYPDKPNVALSLCPVHAGQHASELFLARLSRAYVSRVLTRRRFGSSRPCRQRKGLRGRACGAQSEGARSRASAKTRRPRRRATDEDQPAEYHGQVGPRSVFRCGSQHRRVHRRDELLQGPDAGGDIRDRAEGGYSIVLSIPFILRCQYLQSCNSCFPPELPTSISSSFPCFNPTIKLDPLLTNTTPGLLASRKSRVEAMALGLAPQLHRRAGAPAHRRRLARRAGMGCLSEPHDRLKVASTVLSLSLHLL